VAVLQALREGVQAFGGRIQRARGIERVLRGDEFARAQALLAHRDPTQGQATARDAQRGGLLAQLHARSRQPSARTSRLARSASSKHARAAGNRRAKALCTAGSFGASALARRRWS
jgi:hypothetical protein